MLAYCAGLPSDSDPYLPAFAPLVRHELLPTDVARIGVLQTDRPVLRRHRHSTAVSGPRAATDRIAAPAAIDIRPRIGRVLQHIQHPRIVRRPPDNLVRRRSAQRPHRQSQASLLKIAHHGFGAAEFAELAEQDQQPGLYLLVRIENHTAVAAMAKPRRQWHAQLAPGRLLALALVEANLDLVQLCFAHDAGQAQKQTIVIGAWIVRSE